MSYRKSNLYTYVEEIRRRRAEPACDSPLSAHRRHWGNAASQELFQVLKQMVVSEIAPRPHSTSCGASNAITAAAFPLFDHPAYSPDLAPSDYHLFQGSQF
ncbi:hypothetical protein AVEN_44830-1 [Araneus ventricosus]|uniref:Tc1-like transposase DDE domain-containing protein n=1 Tax=Araneus ventricosus TaxID=182803 RepID=A0A4Y2CJT7_ARAVE|nr:hypothetical protein AVEN_44830-1 [Araneus ventricosus]